MVPTDRRFTDQRFEGGIGLYDYGARFYDPTVGRFVQPDLLVLEFTNPQDINRYSYGRNSPLTYVDVGGRFPLIPFVIAGAVALAGAAASPTVVNAPSSLDATVPSDEWAAARGVAAGSPVVGDVNDLVAVATGHDVIMREDLTPEQRAITGGLAAAPFVSGALVRRAVPAGQTLLAEILRRNGGSTPILGAATDPQGGLLAWLEEGRPTAGWQHIVEGHFAGRFGNHFLTFGPQYSDPREVQRLIIEAAQARGGTTGSYEVPGTGKRLTVVIGSNGFIVTAYPEQ
jgi:RHS repeat-associated protein